MARTGRPKKEISKEWFEKLCGMQCTLDEIAGFFNCSADTIERFAKSTYKKTFAEIYKEYSVQGKISLRRYQFKLAEKSAAMAIWLGKQYLGQRDVQDVTLTSGVPEEIKQEVEALLNDESTSNSPYPG